MNACIAGWFRSAKNPGNSHSSPDGACWMRRNGNLRPMPAPGEAHRFLLRVTSHSAKYASCSCLTLGVHSICVRALRTQMLEIEFHRPCQALAAQISGEAFAVAILPVSLWFDVARPRARLRQPPPQLFGHELGSLSERMFSGFPRYGIARLMRTSITHIIILPFTDLTEL